MDDFASQLHPIRRFFESGATREYAFRRSALDRLATVLRSHEQEILDALKAELGKPVFEAYAAEIGAVYDEIAYARRHLRSWMKPKRVWTPLLHFLSWSRIVPEPKGVVLVIAPWNYPFQLVFAPLIGSIAAGNCVVLKPSELAPRSAAVLERIIREAFPSGLATVVQGVGKEVIPALMSAFRFDHVFFTGSGAVGRSIAKMAAEQLIPVTLELGGKSPCIVDASANLQIAAKRIVWGKFFNAGQTCTAPDYVMVHESVNLELIERMRSAITEMFGDDPLRSADLCRIINDEHLNRLQSYLSAGSIATGGRVDTAACTMEPTILTDVTLDHPVMKSEIFGPILPVLTYRTLEEAAGIINQNPWPLALYCFTADRDVERFFTERIQFGGGGINTSLVHVVNSRLPFGGIGYSGSGEYHGKFSFSTFSHFKGLTTTAQFPDIPIRYAPYKGKSWILRLLMKP